MNPIPPLRRFLPFLALAASLQITLGYYDPAAQRWINRDPIGERGGNNLYAFLRNASMASIDAFGTEVSGGGLTVVGGRTVCDGTGGFVMRVYNNDVDSICTKRHENQHIKDFERKFPKACYGPDGKPLLAGSNPIVPAEEEYAFRTETECSAYRISLQCLEELLCQPGMQGASEYLKLRKREVKRKVDNYCWKEPPKWHFLP